MCWQEPHEDQWREIRVSCHWGGIAIGTSTVSGPSSWKAAWQKKTWESWWKTMSQQCAESPLHIRLQVEEQCLLAEWGDPSLLVSTGEIHLEFWVQVWVPSAREKRTLEGLQWKSIQKVEHWSTWCMRKKLACSAWKKGVQRKFHCKLPLAKCEV